MSRFDEVLGRLEGLVEAASDLDEPARSQVFELLDGIDLLHRRALDRLGRLVGDAEVNRLRAADATVAWLFDAYAVGVDERAAAEAALEEIRPYVDSHGGQVTVLSVVEGVVQVEMSGACAGCTASAATLRGRIEEALRDGLPGFVAVEAVEPVGALAHPPPSSAVPVVLGTSRPDTWQR